MSDPCPRQGRAYGGCRFEARYDEEPLLEEIKAGHITVPALRSFLDNTVKKTYVRDVCTRCGRTIERQKP